MKKFAFLVHVRSSYQLDMAAVAAPLGWIPEPVYEFVMRNRPVSPFLWSKISMTPNSKEAEGYVIMIPYSGKQMLMQQRAMMPRIEQAMQLAGSLGAEIVGLGALTSPVTLGGKLLTNQSDISVTNGNAFTAVITWRKVAQMIHQCSSPRPVVALVGATGSVGHLVSTLLATHTPDADYLLVARNERRLNTLASEMSGIDARVKPRVSLQMDSVKQADIVVLLTSSAEALLESKHLKRGAVVLDDTVPRNTHPMLAHQRPDVKIIDGGLVAMPHIRISRDIGLPDRTSYACLAETMLLAKAGHQGHFSIGNPNLDQAEYISNLALQYADLGFRPAPDHSFGELIQPRPAIHYPFSQDLATSLSPSFS